MKKTVFSLTTLMLVALLGMGTLTARENTLAAGIQVGLAATGVVMDLQEGSLGLSAGLNYSIGYAYFISSSDEVNSEYQIDQVITITADITTAFNISDSFALKAGINTIAFTNFGSFIGGMAGPCMKGEYWIPNKNIGLFVNLNAPIMLYGIAVDEYGESDSLVDFIPQLPLLGLLTTSFGVLFSF